jgi:hypothetical protein
MHPTAALLALHDVEDVWWDKISEEMLEQFLNTY